MILTPFKFKKNLCPPLSRFLSFLIIIMYFFLPSFCPFCFSSFCLFPIFFCFVSDSGVFLPALLAVLFFLFQKIFSFSFPAFCRTSFRSSCLHHPSALTRPVRPALQSLYRLFFTFRLHRPFFAKTFLSEIPSFRSLQPLSHANITVGPKTNLSALLYRAFAVFLTSCLCHPFSAKTFLSEIPSPRSLQPLSLANITVSPKTDLPENLSRLRVVFPANLLSKLYFLSLSRCFRFLVYKCSLRFGFRNFFLSLFLSSAPFSRSTLSLYSYPLLLLSTCYHTLAALPLLLLPFPSGSLYGKISLSLFI